MKHQSLVAVNLATLLLVGCGGGGGSTSTNSTTPTPTLPTSPVNGTSPQSSLPVVSQPINPAPLPSNTTAGNADNQTSNNLLSMEANIGVVEAVNKARETCGFGKLQVNDELAKSAQNHLNYLKVVAENTQTVYSSHAESPTLTYTKITENSSDSVTVNNSYYSGATIKERVAYKSTNNNALPVNYTPSMVAENLTVSGITTAYPRQEVFSKQDGYNAVNQLLSAPYHTRSILMPGFTEIGASTNLVQYQKNNWYTYLKYTGMTLATPLNTKFPEVNRVLTYPCNNVDNTEYKLENESPSPFGDKRDLSTNPIGQPVYIRTDPSKKMTSYEVTMSDSGVNIDLIALDANNDPNHILKANDIFMMPNKPLKPATKYDVQYTIKYSDGTVDIGTFTFGTKA